MWGLNVCMMRRLSQDAVVAATRAWQQSLQDDVVTDTNWSQMGRTALMTASEGGYLGVVRVLLAAGANTEAKESVVGAVGHE